MREYELPYIHLKKLAPHQDAFQAAVAVIANREFGITSPPAGIEAESGGVRVNNVDVKIYSVSVAAGRPGYNEHTREVAAVIAAIYEADNMFWKDGPAALTPYGKPVSGGPLKAMFGNLAP